MKRTAGIIWLAGLLVAVAAHPAAAQANGAGGDAVSSKTIWDGVYTDAQATRGQRTSQQNCGSCHSPSSEWSSSMFLTAWSGRAVRELHNHIKMTMPYDAPGRLSNEQYADIVAYMLKLNNVPAGETELPSDDEGLGAISVTREASR
jgi:S-disulfanyl-L-cysteine oxidoreductase SoxD